MGDVNVGNIARTGIINGVFGGVGYSVTGMVSANRLLNNLHPVTQVINEGSGGVAGASGSNSQTVKDLVQTAETYIFDRNDNNGTN